MYKNNFARQACRKASSSTAEAVIYDSHVMLKHVISFLSKYILQPAQDNQNTLNFCLHEGRYLIRLRFQIFTNRLKYSGFNLKSDSMTRTLFHTDREP